MSGRPPLPPAAQELRRAVPVILPPNQTGARPERGGKAAVQDSVAPVTAYSDL